MTYRVLIDYGNLEIRIWVKTEAQFREQIIQAAYDEMSSRGFELGSEPPIIMDIQECFEWDLD